MSDTRLLKAVDAVMPSLADLFAGIGAATADVVGISRDAFGAKETRCAEMVRDFAQREGLDAAYDPVGNLAITAAGALGEVPEVLVASHVDSVPRGGNYDGLAGVLAGIGALVALREAGIAIPGLRVLAFRGEESPWFGTAYLGSKLFLGQLGAAERARLRRFDTGLTLAEHMQRLGLAVPQEGVPVAPMERIRAYIELHIEQGPLLESLGVPVGLATAIRGNIRHPFARCLGSYAHSAAMPRHLRADAVTATAKLIAFADERCKVLIEEGHDDLVFTCGIFHTDAEEHAMTKVPGEVTFSLNVGATSDAVMQAMQEAIAGRAAALEAEHHVRFALGDRVGTPAMPLDGDLAATILAAARRNGLAVHRMPTVGHDAAMFARRGIPAAVLLVRNANGSHNPDEHMEMADFAAGLRVLATSLASMAPG
jgi:N-carbamoyl-L-amino-acid hydrolase